MNRRARLNRLLRQSVLDEFVPRAVKGNYTWLDCKARPWLKLHRNDLVIVDAGKGLGDCIIRREWVDTELNRLLSSGFARLAPDVYKARSFEARCLLSVSQEKLRTPD